MGEKKVILIFIGHFLPGYKYGGPLRTVVNTIERLGEHYNFKIVTSNHDLGEVEEYKGIVSNTWTPYQEHQVYYIKGKWSFKLLKELIQESKCDFIYLNGILNYDASIKILLLRRIGEIKVPVILAARGELSPGALNLKRTKKRIFLTAAKGIGLYKGLTFQATSSFEEADIIKAMGATTRIRTVSDLPKFIPSGTFINTKEKEKGAVKLVFISRISPKKNLLQNIRMLSRAEGKIEFDIYGPIEDVAYWDICKDAISAVNNKNIHIAYKGVLDNTDVYNVLQEYHFFYFLTLSENFGHVIYEAFASGCPPIISDQTPWRYLQKKNAGWDLPLADEDAIFKVVQECIDMDEDSYNRMSQDAFSFAKDFCYNSSIVEDNINLFQH